MVLWRHWFASEVELLLDPRHLGGLGERRRGRRDVPRAPRALGAALLGLLEAEAALHRCKQARVAPFVGSSLIS